VSARDGDDRLWQRLCAYSDTFTCYSAAVASWVACEPGGWERVVNPGLCLTVTEAGDGLFGFAHFSPSLRSTLGLMRVGSDDPAAAQRGVLDELARSGRVIVAGDGFSLPWHVAHERRHVPHWFVLRGGGDRAGLLLLDPFAARNELGVQAAASEPIEHERLGGLLSALPGDDRVLLLRESLAFGDDAGQPAAQRFQWFVHAEVGESRSPQGADGPLALLRLARHFREHGQSAEAYAQADDLWSIARHRAFLARYALEVADRRGDGALAAWVGEHAAPLALKWGHIAPLVMQATLAVGAGRSASASVPDTLESLAERERAAAEGFPADAAASRSSPAVLEPA
jgi:hypothetical protein